MVRHLPARLSRRGQPGYSASWTLQLVELWILILSTSLPSYYHLLPSGRESERDSFRTHTRYAPLTWSFQVGWTWPVDISLCLHRLPCVLHPCQDAYQPMNSCRIAYQGPELSPLAGAELSCIVRHVQLIGTACLRCVEGIIADCEYSLLCAQPP